MMIDPKDVSKNFDKCFECHSKIESEDVFYAVKKCKMRADGEHRAMHLTVVNQFVVSSFEAEILFCNNCWEHLAGQRYSFDESRNYNIFDGIKA